MDDRLSRRNVLVGGSLTAALVGLGGATWWYATGDSSEDADAGDAGSPESVALVGAAYLAEHPDEADAAVLRDALPTLTGTDPDQIIEQLPTIDDAVRADFAEDRVVAVSGWVLARTEARAAALVHLVAA